MRTKTAVVTSAKMTGTVTVTVHRSVFHPLYQKRYRVSTKFLADSKGMDVGVGDTVVIGECRPLSKRKHFRVIEVVKRAPRVSEMAEEGALGDVMKSKQLKQSMQPKNAARDKKNSSIPSTASTSSTPS